MYISDHEIVTELGLFRNNKKGVLRAIHMKPECNATFACRCQVCNTSGKDVSLYSINVEVPEYFGVIGGVFCEDCATTIFNRRIE